jgi:hypothetical protein
MKILFSILLIFTMFQAHASRECDWAIQVNKDLPGHIGARNRQIDLFKSLIAEGQRTLEKELNPRLEDARHAVSIYSFKEQTTKDAQDAVQQSIVLVQNLIINNRAVRNTINRLSKRGISFNQPLSDQIREAISHIWFNYDLKSKLEQLANSVNLIETKQSGWQTSENEMLTNYLKTNSSLSDDLVQRLASLSDQLRSDLEQLTNAQSQDQSRLDEIIKSITAVNAKISEHQTSIEALNKQNQDDQAYAKVWDVRARCQAEWDQARAMRQDEMRFRMGAY